MAIHKCSIIADPNGYGFKYAEKIYKELSKKTEAFELNAINITKFRDGEIKPKIELNIRKRNCYFLHDSNLPPSDWFLQLCLVNEIMKYSAAQEIIDVLPYLRFARQDRKDESRVPISTRAIAETIGLHADRVLTLDVHNPAIQSAYRIPFDGLEPTSSVIDFIKKEKNKIDLEKIAIMSTDTGGGERAKQFAKILRVDFVECYKYRPSSGEVEKVKILGNVNNRNILVIDDIIDSGNTLIKTVETARGQGAKNIYAYCTHGLFTAGVRRVTDCFDRIYIGDTMDIESILKSHNEELGNNTRIISFVPLFAEAINRTSEGESLSELFE